MVKPTFMQSLLNKPTQSYTFPPPKKDYHSQKKELVKIAQAYRDDVPAHLDSAPEFSRANTSTASSTSAGEGSASGRSSSSRAGAKPLKVTDHSTNDTLMPPNDQQFTRANVMSPNEVITIPNGHLLRPPKRSLYNLKNNSDADSDSQEEVFYTPNTSPRTSMISQSPQIVASLIPIPTSPPRQPLFDREHSADSMTSTTATTSAADIADIDSVSADGSSHSLFSLPSSSDSTWLTTPVASDAGHCPKPGTKRSMSPLGIGLGVALNETQNDVTFNSVGSSPSHLVAPTPGPPPRRSATAAGRTKRSSTTYIYTTPGNSITEDNWAKDVRWLVAPSSISKPKSPASYSINSYPIPKRPAISDRFSIPKSGPAPATLNGQKALSHRRSKSLVIDSPRTLQPQIHTQHEPQLYPAPAPQRRLQHRRSKSAVVRKTKTVMSMTALVEVEEPLEVNELHHALMGRDRTRTHSLLQTPSKSQLTSQPSRSRVSSSPSTPPLTLSPPPKSQYTSNSRTVTLPTPLSVSSTASTSTHAQNLPSSGTPGYTSLVLPRAAYSSASKPKGSSKLGFGFGVLGGGEVDLTMDGMAQTTMATVEVVRGIAKASTLGLASNSAAKTSRRKMSFTMPSFLGRSPTPKGKEKAVDESPLTFTSWRKPPGYVGANGVLVQVWAVAVDGVDQTLVKGAGPSSPSKQRKGRNRDGESTKKADVGFVPGRSYVGRVLECGWEVREDIIKKNDWVVGLLDVKKCGAMAEFVVVDRRRLHRVPYPRMQSNGANPDVPSHAYALTLEELALLPLAGIPAQRAVRTFTPIEAEATAPPRALVLRGQEGAGAMAVQMLANRGWRVSVHVPVPTRLPTCAGVSWSYADEESRRKEYLDETEDVIRAWGAEEVLFVRQHDDDPEGRDGAVKLMERLLEEGEEFDGVLDTMGGKEVWDAGEALLTGRGRSTEAQFTTLMGDTPHRIIPSTGDLFKAGVRSTKKHGSSGAATNRHLSVDSLGIDGRKTKGKAKVRYAWVIINQDVDWEGEDIAESLRAVIRRAAVQDGVRPRIIGDKIVPFEKAPDIFVGGNLCSGGTFVVKVVG